MFGKSDASTSTTEDVKVRPLWVYYFPQALGVLSTEPPCALPTGATSGGNMWSTPSSRAPRRPPLLRPAESPVSTLLTDEHWLSSSSSEPRRLLPYARLLPPLRLPTPLTLSPDDSDELWPLPARPTKLSLPPIDIPSLEEPLYKQPSPAPPPSTRSSPGGKVRGRGGRGARGVRKRRRPARLADLQRTVAALPRRKVHGASLPARCSAALRSVLRNLRNAWTPLTTPQTYIVSRNWSRSERELVCDTTGQESERSSGMSRRAAWAELGARPGASPGLLRRRYSAPETIMRKYRLEQQRELCCSSAGTSRSPASSPARAPPRAPLVRRALLRRAGAAPAPPPAPRPAPAPAPAAPAEPLELLEIVISESMQPLTTSSSLRDYPPPSLPVDIDEYVSGVLLESLNSITDRIESAIGSDSRMSIVEKEIKVRLQNTGVNTIVHLSPTSNNQIIFGNEELCNRDDERDECNNVVEPPLNPESETLDDGNNNPPAAVLRQLQRLFQKSLSRDASPEVSRIEISNVDVYLNSSGKSPTTITVLATAGSREASRGASPPASLVDSLDDPASPRRDVLALLPASPTPSPRPEAFFVAIRDDAAAAAPVAESLPPRLRQRLQRRQRRRQQRAELRRRRPAARDAAALLDALVDELIRTAARDEYGRARAAPPAPPAPRRDPLQLRLDAEKRAKQLRGRLSLQPHPPIKQPTGPRRLYQKSEIMEGSKRVEILEILEYADSSSSSPEASVTETAATRSRRSRIPVPVTSSRRDDEERLRRLLRAALEPATTAAAAARASDAPAAAGAPVEARGRSSSLRFPAVFEAIPEEACAAGWRSAGTSPPPRAATHRATMTSPRVRHAATSPRRPPAAASPRRSPSAASPRREPPAAEERQMSEDSSSSCERGGLLCAAPRRRRAVRLRAAPPPLRPPPPAPPRKQTILHDDSPDPKAVLEVADTKAAVLSTTANAAVAIKSESGTGARGSSGASGAPGNVTGSGWSVTVAGERVPPHELQLRLRFPPAQTNTDPNHDLPRNCHQPAVSSTPDTSRNSVACVCRHCRAPGQKALPPPHPQHPPLPPRRDAESVLPLLATRRRPPRASRRAR